MKEKSEILSLTGLRFIAAFYVFLFHIHMNWQLTAHPFFKGVLDVGAVGMSLFFILSGFLLFLNYYGVRGNFREYFLNRFARIYPIYIAAALATLPWFKIPLGVELKDSIIVYSKYIFILVADIFVIQAWFPSLFGYWNNGGSWSISVEFFCYFLLPMVMPFIVNFSNAGRIKILLIAYLCSAMIGVAAKLFPDPGIAFYYAMPIFRLPEFIIGGSVFLLLLGRPVKKYLWVAQVLLIVLTALYLGYFGGLMPMYVGHNWLVVPVIAFVVASLYAGGGPIDWILSRPIFVWFGKISYCFYSFQALVLKLLIDYHEVIINRFPIFANNKILAILAFIVLTTISAFAYYFVEEPSRRWIKRKWQSKESICQNRSKVVAGDMAVNAA